MGTLRILLAIAVVFAHSPWHDGFVLTGGQAAVQCFYLMSGFLISHVLSTDTYTSFLRFYVNRALRIYPLYFTVAILSLFFAIQGDPTFREIYNRGSTGVRGLLTFSNLAIFGQDWVMFTAIHGGTIHLSSDFRNTEIPVYAGLLLPQTWTLGVELTFYLIAPLLLRRWRRWLIPTTIFSFLVRLSLIASGVGLRDPWSYRFFPAELGLFLSGALIQQYLIPLWTLSVNRFPLLPLLGTLLQALITLFYFLLPIPEAYRLPLYIAFSAVMLPLLFRFQNECSLDKRLARLSYPIYIGHSLVGRALHGGPLWISQPSALLETLLNISLSVIFALFLEHFVEQRFEKLRQRVRSGGNIRATLFPNKRQLCS